ncbi:thioesterase family protein [Pseudonocardia bannensis]|uniref:Acyl-ACP thioesterase-like C-terminal domain-containing protein n=1 Tax=Pseudonocardia bannensis TaxID=630973 RepID=A0A848DJU5_9PSEU|nr:thioesterase family protein [Pseudonocardia bannensis]NMH92835.1 hypothetical protein [Pseudonocardia bannensis]
MTTIAAPVRQEPSLYPVLIEQPTCYSDLDPSRRIGRDAIVRWFENARLIVERDVREAVNGDTPLQTLVASVRVEVLAPLRWDGRYRVGIGVSRVGETSYSYVYGVFADDQCVAIGESTNVHITDSGPAPLPAAVREALTAVAVPGPEAGRPDRDPARLVREAYPFRLDVRTRFGDLDTNRHVNNVALAGWYLDALAELHLDVLGYPTGGPLDGLSPSSLTVEYLDEVRYPAIYQLRVGVLDLDDTSVRYACGLFDGPRCIGLAEAVGAHAAPARTGDEIIELAAAFEPFRMREV